MSPEEIRAYGSAACRQAAKTMAGMETDGAISSTQMFQTQLMMEATRLVMLTELTYYVATMANYITSKPAGAVFGPPPQRSN